MTHCDLRDIHTTGNSFRDALPCANMALKVPRYFYLLMEKPLGRNYQVRSLYYKAAQCNQKTLCLSFFLRPDKEKKASTPPRCNVINPKFGQDKFWFVHHVEMVTKRSIYLFIFILWYYLETTGELGNF